MVVVILKSMNDRGERKIESLRRSVFPRVLGAIQNFSTEYATRKV